MLKSDSSKIEELRAIDSHFKNVYEMEFEKFEEILKAIIRLGMACNDDFRILLDDYCIWREIKRRMGEDR
jgi:hypothetical protein